MAAPARHRKGRAGFLWVPSPASFYRLDDAALVGGFGVLGDVGEVAAVDQFAQEDREAECPVQRFIDDPGHSRHSAGAASSASFPRACPWIRPGWSCLGSSMEKDTSRELQRQSSINELHDEPVGSAPVQLVLPILVQVKPGHFRRMPSRPLTSAGKLPQD